MEFSEIEKMCERSFRYAFDFKKLALIFAVIAALGLLFVCALGLSLSANKWVTTSLAFLPFFISGGALLALGTVLVRAYHDQIKNRDIMLRDILMKSWEVSLSASYIFVPVILTYLLLWIGLGLFCLVKEIPFIGDFFGLLFVFAPFVLNFFSLTLCLLSIFLLFSLTPVLALKNVTRDRLLQHSLEQFNKRPFARLVLMAFALSPLLFLFYLLSSAASLTSFIYVVPEKALHQTLHGFFIMIPFAAILSPALAFFFHMSAEAHIWIQKTEG